jgi:glycine cleavage system H protein
MPQKQGVRKGKSIVLSRRNCLNSIGILCFAIQLLVLPACGSGNTYMPVSVASQSSTITYAKPTSVTLVSTPISTMVDIISATGSLTSSSTLTTNTYVPPWSRTTLALQVPSDLHYIPEGMWVRVEAKNVVRVGITYHVFTILLSNIGSVTNARIRLPLVNTRLKRLDVFGSIETYDPMETYGNQANLIAPLSGSVVEVNPLLLSDNVFMNNFDMYGDGWIILMKIDDPAELNLLQSAEEYAASLK